MSEKPLAEMSPALKEAYAALDEVAAALAEGKSPRGRRRLQDAVRVFREAGQVLAAAQGLRLLAQLELRRDDIPKALTAARSALRLVRPASSGADLDHALDLTARIYSLAGEHEKARAHAEEWARNARDRGDAPALVAALRRLALAAWAAEDTPAALISAEEAKLEAEEVGDPALLQETERILGEMLLQTGCPGAANRILARVLRESSSTEQTVRALFARGWSWLCLGKPDTAARDFRRAWRLAKELPDTRVEIKASAALGAAEAAHSHEESAAARLERAQNRLNRAVRQSQRLRDARLEKVVQTLRQHVEQDLNGGMVSTSEGSATRDQVARSLVRLATSTDCLTLVDACKEEVERLAALKGDGPAYCWALRSPLLLEE